MQRPLLEVLSMDLRTVTSDVPYQVFTYGNTNPIGGSTNRIRSGNAGVNGVPMVPAIQLNPNGAIQGTCAVQLRGQIWDINRGSPAGDSLQYCSRQNGYYWVPLNGVNTVASSSKPAMDLSLGTIQYIAVLAVSATPTITHIAIGQNYAL